MIQWPGARREETTATHRGIVLRAASGSYAVLDEAGVASCRARRRLHRPDPTWPEFPVPGDEVEWQLLGSSGAHREGIVEAVRPRRTEISRTRFGSKHVVVANLDRLAVVIAVREPTLDRGLLDRLLAMAERNGIESFVCFNKVDLIDPGELDSVRGVYERAGYRVVLTSAETGRGVGELRELLRGHEAAFMGPSGAGKSRLLGALQPGLKVRTGDVCEKTGLGRHTTTRVDLHRTDFGALLADTPGVREFGLWKLEPGELRDLFPEFRAPQEGCHFGGCLHVPEPECAVKAAVESGAIDAGRYRSYVAILDELRALAAEERARGPRRERER